MAASLLAVLNDYSDDDLRSELHRLYKRLSEPLKGNLKRLSAEQQAVIRQSAKATLQNIQKSKKAVRDLIETAALSPEERIPLATQSILHSMLACVLTALELEGLTRDSMDAGIFPPSAAPLSANAPDVNPYSDLPLAATTPAPRREGKTAAAADFYSKHVARAAVDSETEELARKNGKSSAMEALLTGEIDKAGTLPPEVVIFTREGAVYRLTPTEHSTVVSGGLFKSYFGVHVEKYVSRTHPEQWIEVPAERISNIAFSAVDALAKAYGYKGTVSLQFRSEPTGSINFAQTKEQLGTLAPPNAVFAFTGMCVLTYPATAP